MKSSYAKVANALIFKAHWLACVLGGAYWGLARIVSLIAFSFAVDFLRRDLPWAVALGAIGAGLDTLWIALGILDYGAGFAPAWIIMLWVGLALTLNHAMYVFTSAPLIGGLLSGCAAPLTYMSGQALGAVVVPSPMQLLVIALTWAVLFYIVFVALARQQTSKYQTRKYKVADP